MITTLAIVLEMLRESLSVHGRIVFMQQECMLSMAALYFRTYSTRVQSWDKMNLVPVADHVIVANSLSISLLCSSGSGELQNLVRAMLRFRTAVPLTCRWSISWTCKRFIEWVGGKDEERRIEEPRIVRRRLRSGLVILIVYPAVAQALLTFVICQINQLLCPSKNHITHKS